MKNYVLVCFLIASTLMISCEKEEMAIESQSQKQEKTTLPTDKASQPFLFIDTGDDWGCVYFKGDCMPMIVITAESIVLSDFFAIAALENDLEIKKYLQINQQVMENYIPTNLIELVMNDYIVIRYKEKNSEDVDFLLFKDRETGKNHRVIPFEL